MDVQNHSKRRSKEASRAESNHGTKTWSPCLEHSQISARSNLDALPSIPWHPQTFLTKTTGGAITSLDLDGIRDALEAVNAESAAAQKASKEDSVLAALQSCLVQPESMFSELQEGGSDKAGCPSFKREKKAMSCNVGTTKGWLLIRMYN